MKVSALMYHAIYSNDSELSAIPEEDRPYAISLSMYQKQLDLLIKDKIQVINPDFLNEDIQEEDTRYVLLTFDDGHSSFYHYAFPELVKRNMAGIFFITSDLINSRPDFCSWEQLKEMSKTGMSIQSHGKTHKFISDLDLAESKNELLESKKSIEEELDANVNIISFPGGRYSMREISVGKELGYTYFFTSTEGVNNLNGNNDSCVLKRFALRNTTSLDEFLKLSRGDYYLILKRVVINKIKNTVKKIIGNDFYHVVYKRHKNN